MRTLLCEETPSKVGYFEKNAEGFSTAKNDLVCPRARLDLAWAYGFPDQTGLDIQICKTGPARQD